MRRKILSANSPRVRHGDSMPDSKHHYIYKALDSMMQRCYNNNSHNYKYYGAKGVTVNDAWLGDYLAFKSYVLEVIGERPTKEHSIDRINRSKNYTDGNIRWATKYEQVTNRSISKLTTEDVKEIKWLLSLDYSGAAIGRDYNVKSSMISRIKTGIRHAKILY